MDLKAYLEDKRQIINTALKKILNRFTHHDRLIQAMTYSLMAGGKRIRPILCLSAVDAVGGQYTDNIINAACAIEIIHTYSLIHDDLPAMDNDRLRRGKPTCHVQFDEATAILAGDALLTLAFDLLSSAEASKSEPAAKWLRVIHIMTTAAGHKGMIEGQMLDILNEGESVSLDKLKTMHALKTGALIEASVVSGGILGGGNDNQIDALMQYGKNIGLAFQVVDDILNVEGDPLILGKDTGTDAARNKSTYPALMGIEASKRFAAELLNNALQALGHFDKNTIYLREIAAYIISRKK